MYSKIEIMAYLSGCTTSAGDGCVNRTGLVEIHKCAFNHRKKFKKVDIVRDLSEFYADKANITNIWYDLSECERDFITYIVQFGGKEYLPTTIEYAKKYNFVLVDKTSWGYENDLLNSYRRQYLRFLFLLERNFPKTKTVLFFPNGREMPPFVFDVLKTLVSPMTFEYEEHVPEKSNVIICRENRCGDFAAIVRFASRERFKVKQNTFDITKSKLAKLSESIGFDEVCDMDGRFCSPKEAKRNNDIKVAQPLFLLAANSGLLEIDKDGTVLPGKKSGELLSMPHSALVKKLFNDYIKENRIYELHYITYITATDGDWWIKWHECRKPIIELLKTCPIDKFVKFEAFDKYARVFHGNFFRRLLNCALRVKGFDFGYDHYGGYEPDWDECEAQIIRLILSFLSALGMVDVEYTEDVPRIKYSDDDYCVGIAGFRITKLGAWILGLADTYVEIEDTPARNNEGRLLVLPDYSVIISGLKCRIEYETYLSTFLTRVSDDDNAAIYKIDFQSAIRAFGAGITPNKIKTYLKKASSEPLPDNVVRSLDDWQAKVGRVKIRNLTVLDVDDALLLEEIKHIRGMDGIIIGSLNNAVAIDGAQQKKAKALIEKNGWFVKV